MTAADHLIPFTEQTFARYRTAPHHQHIANQLERVERGEIDRLMLLIPPRHGKSELASRRFPAWYLGRHPERQFLSVSATADLATDFGRDVRNLINSVEYQRIFEDVRLAEDSQARGKWNTSAGGIYYALGIGGHLMGRGADVMLIDDPFSSMEDALSEQVRKTTWEWYTGTAYNRLQPGGAVVVINHRMHEDDLSGRLLAQQAAGGDKWTVVELPAISDAGEALWPEAYPLAALERIRSNTFPRFWSALYQQRPAPDDGTFFLASWLKPYITAPPRETLAVYGGSDYAVTADGGDFTVHVVVGIDPDGHMYLLDMWRKQAESKEWVEAFCALVKQWKPHEWAEEQGQINAALGPFIDEEQRKHQAFVYRSTFPTRHEKAIRARSIQGRMAVDGLYVPQYAGWMADLRSELLSFPAGKHDDIVDALGLIGQLLHRIGLGQKPEPKLVDQFASGYRSYQRSPANNDAVLTA